MDKKTDSYCIIPELRIIVCSFSGKTEFRDIVNLFQRYSADKDFDNSFNIINDFRNATFLGFRYEVESFVPSFEDSLSNRGSKFDPIFMGILYDTPNQKFLFEEVTRKENSKYIKISLFQKIEPCLTWMKYTDPAHQDSIRESLHKLNHNK
jgi:hypothetical protein